MAQVSSQPSMDQASQFKPASDPDVPADARTYAIFMHLTLLAYHVIPLPVIGPLIMWAIKKDQSPFIDDHGKEAMNFQLSLVLYAIAASLLGFLTCGIAWMMYLPLYALALVGMILASIAANRGQYFRYPATLRLIR